MTVTAASTAFAQSINGTVEPTKARKIAYVRHDERRDAAGGPVVEHLERVVAAVPGDPPPTPLTRVA
jgi:hypothetical protein